MLRFKNTFPAIKPKFPPGDLRPLPSNEPQNYRDNKKTLSLPESQRHFIASLCVRRQVNDLPDLLRRPDTHLPPYYHFYGETNTSSSFHNVATPKFGVPICGVPIWAPRYRTPFIDLLPNSTCSSTHTVLSQVGAERARSGAVNQNVHLTAICSRGRTESVMTRQVCSDNSSP